VDNLDRRILQLEQRRYVHPGAKERAIREELGLSATRYYQRLNALLTDPRAAIRYPYVVNRLRRLQAARLIG
jgi:hypothetical protein